MGAVITRLVRAEWTKLLTTRVWIGLLLGSCVLVGGFATLFTAFAGDADSGISPVGTADYEQLALAVSANATVLFIVLGIIGTTQEYRHRTATPTFLASPHRGRVIIAKLLAYAVAAIPMAVIVIAVDVLVVSVYAGARGAAPSLSGDNLRVLGGAWAALVIYTVIGVGVGALIRNQVGAIIGALGWIFLVEPLLTIIPGFDDVITKWFPSGAANAAAGTADSDSALDQIPAGLLLAAYAAAFVAAGIVIVRRRDVSA
jgi:ABC-2 type transport system permease protein